MTPDCRAAGFATAGRPRGDRRSCLEARRRFAQEPLDFPYGIQRAARGARRSQQSALGESVDADRAQAEGFRRFFAGQRELAEGGWNQVVGWHDRKITEKQMLINRQARAGVSELFQEIRPEPFRSLLTCDRVFSGRWEAIHF